MATRRIEIQKLVTGLRKSVHQQCKECGRRPGHGLMLGGPGITFSEMVIEPGMYKSLVLQEVEARGLMCRRCWSYSTRVTSLVGLSCEDPSSGSECELMGNPKVRERMKELGVKVPQDALDRGVPQIEGMGWGGG